MSAGLDIKGLDIQGLDIRGLAIGRPGWSLPVADLAVPAGSRLAVLGPNGAGKTTLLKTLAGLIRPLAGEICVAGRSLTGRAPRETATLCAYAPSPGEVTAPFTALDMVLMPLSLRRRLTPADREAGLAALSEMGVEPLAERRFDRLSSGQRQLVLAARVLIQDVPLCLFDEPTATLDPVNRDRVETAMARLAAQGRTVVFSSHDRAQLAHADRWLAVSDGKAWEIDRSTLDDPAALATIYGGAAPR